MKTRKLFHGWQVALMWLLMLASCQSPTSRLEAALQQSGSNRSELERVLTHYSRQVDDSLHLKAACFLIENMPGHCGLNSPYLATYRASMDSLYPDMSNVVKAVVYTIPSRMEELSGVCTRKEDIQCVTADFLITHIDNAVAMWRSCPWLRTLSFADFCEYLLPYRVTTEPLLKADSTLYLWKEVAKDMKHYGYIPQSLDDVKSFQRNLIGNRDDVYFLNMPAPLLPGGKYTLDSLDICYYDVAGFRLSGVPSVIDFIPDWSTRNGRHYWRVLIDQTCLHDNFSNVLNPKTAKVYRITYSHNPTPRSNGREHIPFLFSEPFYRDVTEQYLKTTHLTVTIKKSFIGYTPDNLYLCIFNDLEWKPVAWAENRKGKGEFKNMGLNMVYLPVCYEGNEMLNTGYPLYVDLQGHSRELVPDTTRKITMQLGRKYPLTYSKIHWTKSLDGCCIEASDLPDFSRSDTLCRISHTSPSLNWMTLPVRSERLYRYWRISKKGRFMELGELRFIDEYGKEAHGSLIADADTTMAAAAFDGDILTYSKARSWFGMDCRKPVRMKEIRYISRTDGNGICPGHDYELFYYAFDGWVSLGRQTATSDTLCFESVPSGALYWLKNYSEGREERIFTYENGEVHFR